MTYTHLLSIYIYTYLYRTVFNNLALMEIDGFEDNEKFQIKLISWAKYHIRKGDIVFTDSTWRWNPTRIKRYGKCTKVIVPREYTGNKQ